MLLIYVLVLLQASLKQRSKTTLLAEIKKHQQGLQAQTQYTQVVAGEFSVCHIVYELLCQRCL